MKTLKHNLAFKWVAIFVILAMLHLSTGCNYYQYQTAESTASGLEKIDETKYVIVHMEDQAFHLANLEIDQEKQQLFGHMLSILPKHRGHLEPLSQQGLLYFPSDESPTNEVHLRINAYENESDSTVLIPFSAIKQIHVFSDDPKAEINSYVVGSIVSVVFLLAIPLLGILSARRTPPPPPPSTPSSSCPFIYAKNGNSLTFYGEIYAGAVMQNMERDDYMPLPGFEPEEGMYELKIANELPERQYTDIAELIAVTHPRNMQVMLDKHGQLHTLSDLILPTSAMTDEGTDLREGLSLRDSLYYGFLDMQIDNPAFSSVNMQFPKPQQAEAAKLLLRAKNTVWLDYIFGKFNSELGRRYEKIEEKQKTVPAEEKRQWLIEQGMLLEVQLKTADGWNTVDYVDMVGPFAARDLLIPIDLTDHEGEVVEIRLAGGFHFWELDYAAIDYTENVKLETTTLKATAGIDENGANVLSTLAQVDGNYLTQLEIGNEALLKFDAPLQTSENQAISVFLHTRGYYEYIRNFEGRPNLAKMRKVNKEAGFAHYAKEELLEISGMSK